MNFIARQSGKVGMGRDGQFIISILCCQAPGGGGWFVWSFVRAMKSLNATGGNWESRRSSPAAGQRVDAERRGPCGSAGEGCSKAGGAMRRCYPSISASPKHEMPLGPAALQPQRDDAGFCSSGLLFVSLKPEHNALACLIF